MSEVEEFADRAWAACQRRMLWLGKVLLAPSRGDHDAAAFDAV